MDFETVAALMLNEMKNSCVIKSADCIAYFMLSGVRDAETFDEFFNMIHPVREIAKPSRMSERIRRIPKRFSGGVMKKGRRNSRNSLNIQKLPKFPEDLMSVTPMMYENLNNEILNESISLFAHHCMLSAGFFDQEE